MMVVLFVAAILGLASFIGACPGHVAEDRYRRLETAKLPQLPSTCGIASPTKEEKLETGKVLQDWKKRKSLEASTAKAGSVVYRIPVIFHIIRTDTGDGDVSDPMLQEYMFHLNNEFSNTPFQFYTQSIARVDNSAWHSCDYNNHFEFAQALYTPGTKSDLHIYFCSITTGSGGWAYFPQEAGRFWDGMVVESDYTKYGFPADWVRRTILPHETGHWLGLYHTFEDECDATWTTSSNWPEDYRYFNGDGVLDTPAHQQSSNRCATVADTCPDNVPGVDPGPDPTDNIMSYATDSCRQKFTPGQIERMVAMYEYFRKEAATPTDPPTVSPTTQIPTEGPSTVAPSVTPTKTPTKIPTGEPSASPTTSPTGTPTETTTTATPPTHVPSQTTDNLTEWPSMLLNPTTRPSINALPTRIPTIYPGYACVNNQIWRDTGCESGIHGEAKVCVLDNGTEPEAGQPGDKCVPCVNHQAGGKDRGCTKFAKVCVLQEGTEPIAGQSGDKCVPCVNHKSNGKDRGCSRNSRVCVLEDGTEPQSQQSGDKCVPCVNYKETGKDRGCTNANPRCVNQDGTEPVLGLAGYRCEA